MVNAYIGGALVFLAVMIKLHLKPKNIVGKGLAKLMFISGWAIILQNVLAESPNETTDLLFNISVIMIVVGAVISRHVFDTGAKKAPQLAMMMFMGGWALMNGTYVFGTFVDTDKKVGLVIGSLITLAGVMQNRQAELKLASPLVGAGLFGLGWAAIGNALQ